MFFSIVVPIHDVEQFLPECLDSILNQNFNDMEIIAVDDQSTDNSGAILDQYAARDTRISAIHLPENVGLGLARNAGLDAATGEYVLFLDSDDLFAPNALIETAQRLTRSDKPAVMAFNYSRMWPDGRVAHPSDSSVLHKLSGTTFVPRYEPAVFIPVGFAWNKAYKREFLTAHRIKFRAGFYEDISWTYEVLLKAQTAIARDWVVVLYRQRKSGSILASTSGKHFDVFAQYDAVFDFLDEQSVSPALRKLAYDKMINHFVAIWQIGRAHV